MDIKPLQDRVVVKRVEEGETKEGEPNLPDSPQEGAQQGEVVEVGEQAGLEVQVGDRVLFGKYSGAELKEGGADYLVLKESEILEVLESSGPSNERGVTDLPGGTGTDTD